MSCPPQLWPGIRSDHLCHLMEVRREQYSQGRITSDVPAPPEIQAVKDFVHVARRCRLRTSTRKWQLRWVWAWSERVVQTCLTPACCLILQVGAALSA